MVREIRSDFAACSAGEPIPGLPPLVPVVGCLDHPQHMPPATVASVWLTRPGLRLRASDDDPDLHRCVCPQQRGRAGCQACSRSRVLTLCSAWLRRLVAASCFAPEGAPKHFVALDHKDPGYRYFFGELMLCFTCVHEGVVHECCLVSYLWPRDVFTREKDGVPLETKYEFMRTKTYEVVSAASVLFRAPLVTPPPFEELGPRARVYYVLNDDVYGNF